MRLRAALAAAVLGGVYVIANSMDYADALVADAMRKEQAAMNIALTLPLDCDAWVIQSGPGVPPKTYCYSRKSQWKN